MLYIYIYKFREFFVFFDFGMFLLILFMWSLLLVCIVLFFFFFVVFFSKICSFFLRYFVWFFWALGAFDRCIYGVKNCLCCGRKGQKKDRPTDETKDHQQTN